MYVRKLIRSLWGETFFGNFGLIEYLLFLYIENVKVAKTDEKFFATPPAVETSPTLRQQAAKIPDLTKRPIGA